MSWLPSYVKASVASQTLEASIAVPVEEKAKSNVGFEWHDMRKEKYCDRTHGKVRGRAEWQPRRYVGRQAFSFKNEYFTAHCSDGHEAICIMC